MRRTTALSLAATLPLAGLALAMGPADACTDLGDGVLACTSTGWLSCDGAVEGKVKDPLTAVGFDRTAPTGSFTEGEGCGMAEYTSLTGTAPHSLYDLGVEGRMTGNVDSVTVELHSIHASRERVSGPARLGVRLSIDGKSPSGVVTNPGTTTDITSPVEFEVLVDPEPSATGLSERLAFTITDLGAMFPELNEVGDGSGNRQNVVLTINWINTAYAGAWVWGASEVPANVTFNGGEVGTVVSASDLAF